MGTKIKTRDKILRTSRLLFNEEGEGQVSTVDIASVLGMSPGNLYYHFKGKEVIIHDLFAEFETEIKQVLPAQIDTSFEIDDVWVFVYIIFEEIYDFRFFYHNISAILERCPDIKPKFSRILALKKATCFSIISALEKDGFLTFHEEEKEALCERMTAHLTFWLQYYTLRDVQTSPKNLIHYGVYETLVQIVPYVTEGRHSFAALLIEFFARKMR